MVTFGVPEKAVSLAFTYSETWNDLVTLRTYSRCLHALVFALHSNYPLFQWYHRRTVYFREKCGCRTNYDIYWHILCRHSSNVFCYSSKGNFDFCGNILPPWSMLVVCCKEKAGFYQQNISLLEIQEYWKVLWFMVAFILHYITYHPFISVCW